MLSEEQQTALDLAARDRAEPFVPLPVGYIGFQARNNGLDDPRNQLVIIPGNQLIRRRINSIRRSDLASTLKISLTSADIIFTEVNGWQPAIDHVVAFFGVFQKNPTINDNELKYAHGVCFWKQSQKRAIRALRFYFNNQRVN